MSAFRRLPYGMTNFETIRLENYYYVDKTGFIPKMEAANRFFFYIRPRRFGKTLHMAMLRYYYDIATKDKFEALFKGLYIYDYPTPERNSYLVLFLNFAEVSGSIEGYVERMDATAASGSTTSARDTGTCSQKGRGRASCRRRQLRRCYPA